MLQQTDRRVASLCADGAYDAEGVYEAAQRKGHSEAVRVLIPPARDARLSRAPSKALRERNMNIRVIRDLGRREWHRRSGYSKRSLVENAIYRYKTILGRSLRSRGLAGQRIEVQLGGAIINRMVRLGMPDSYRVA